MPGDQGCRNRRPNAVAGQIDADQIAGVVKAKLSASAANAANGSFELRVHPCRRLPARISWTRDFSLGTAASSGPPAPPV